MLERMKMISKTKINKRMKKKTDSELVETILLAKKSNPELAALLAVPTRKRITLNLDEINKKIKEEKTVIVPGKVLGKGQIDKKVKIIALNFSANALEKLKKEKIETSTIDRELKHNKKIEGKIIS